MAILWNYWFHLTVFCILLLSTKKIFISLLQKLCPETFAFLCLKQHSGSTWVSSMDFFPIIFLCTDFKARMVLFQICKKFSKHKTITQYVNTNFGWKALCMVSWFRVIILFPSSFIIHYTIVVWYDCNNISDLVRILFFSQLFLACAKDFKTFLHKEWVVIFLIIILFQMYFLH